jgi:hypothetical protein
MEMTAVHKTLLKTLGISATAAALALFAYGATAQEKKAAPAKKPAACTTLKDEAACKAREDCTWAEPKGKAKKGSCKAKPKAKAPAKGK